LTDRGVSNSHNRYYRQVFGSSEVVQAGRKMSVEKIIRHIEASTEPLVMALGMLLNSTTGSFGGVHYWQADEKADI